MEKKKTLLQKYSIPIHHLDFKYIENCTNQMEMENIVKILRSGQEGYYPDLTKCAEDKLHEIYPESKALRKEVPMLTKFNLSSSEWKEQSTPVIEWAKNVKTKDKTLLNLHETENDNDESVIELPPVRHQKGIIDLDKIKSEKNSKPSEKQENSNPVKSTSSERIKSTDYNKWDKYDADTEIWKMDLKEEREKEELEIVKEQNLKKSNLIQDITNEQTNISDKVNKLSTIEKENLADSYKNRGNEYFRTKEYLKAVNEYTKSISVLPKAAGYNNRALANFKLKNFNDALEDCNKCLKIEPKNIKALLRKAEALIELKSKLEAFKVYNEVISIEPQNLTAQDGRDKIRKVLPYLKPVVTTRIAIEEENSTESTNVDVKKIQKSKEKTHDAAKVPPTKPEDDRYDLAKLIKPKKFTKSKLTKAMETIAEINSIHKNEAETEKMASNKIKIFDEPEIKILNTNRYEKNKSNSKLLIEEIN